MSSFHPELYHCPVLHIMDADKFIEPFIQFIEEYHPQGTHQYLILDKNETYKITERSNIKFISKKFSSIHLLFALALHGKKSEKIIIHNLISRKKIRVLWLAHWVLKKCYWMIWGADLYKFQSNNKDIGWKLDNFFRHIIIKKMKGLVSYVPGDIDLAREHYSATGKYHECLLYPSNLYKELPVIKHEKTIKNILIGNSADPSNNHFEALKTLALKDNGSLKLYCPLSYGEQGYAKEIAESGRKLFGERFIPLFDFMSFEEYLNLLGKVDIAIFAHDRQQAMGNIITLLGLGKKVYIKHSITPWEFFNQLGIDIFDLNDFSLETLDDEARQKNKKIIKTYFSKENLSAQLTDLFKPTAPCLT